MDGNFVHPSDTSSGLGNQMNTGGAQPYTPPVQAASTVPAATTGPVGFAPSRPVADVTPAATGSGPMFSPAQPAAIPVVAPSPVVAAPVVEQPANNFASQIAPPKRIGFKRANGIRIAAIFSIFMLMTVGATFLFNKGQQPTTGNNNNFARGVVVPEQDLDDSLIVEEAPADSLQISEEALIVNGDIIARGALKMYSGDYFANFVQGSVTADRTYTLPDTDGVVCLNTNNCGFATSDQIATLQGQFAAIPVATAATTGVVSINGFDGAVTLTGGTGINVNGTTVTNTGVVSLVGSGNVVITDLGNGQFDISDFGVAGTGAVTLAPNAPQEDNTNNASINITKTGTGALLRLATGIPSSSTARFVVDSSGAITTGSINWSQVTSKPSLVNTLGGVSGGITLGAGLSMSGQSLLNTGVTSINSQTGNVTLAAGSGIGISGTTVTNLGVTGIIGTPDQVTASANTGSITLSLPQSIAISSSPTFVGLTLTGGLDALSVATNGSVRITSTGVLQNVTNANAANFFTGGTLPVNRGGTGLATLTQNGILYGNGTGNIGMTVAGTTGQCLVGNNAGAPSWQSCATAAEGATPGGTAGGDLSGSYPNPSVAKLQGTTISLGGLTGGDFLFYDGTSWVNQGITGDVTVATNGVATIADNAISSTKLTTGAVTTNKIGNGQVTNEKLQNSSVTVTAGSGLSGGGAVGLGESTTLSVAYGAVAGTAVQGNTSIVCAAGTGNLSGGGQTLTLGSGGSCGNLSISNAPTFSTSVTSPEFILTGVGSNGSIRVANLGQATTFTLPDPGTSTAEICLSTGNCSNTSAAGGDLTGNFPNPTVAKLQGTGLSVVSVAGGELLIYNAANSAWQNTALNGDVTVSQTGLATIQANSVSLGVDTTGNYIATLGTLTGLTTSGNSGEGSTPTLSVTYGSSGNTAVQGNTGISVTAGTNLTGGGSITLGAGGNVTLGVAEDPIFNISVTSPIFQGAGAMTLNTLATAGADDIIISAAGIEIGRFLESGEYRFEKGSFDLTLGVTTITGSNKTILLPNESGTICTTGSICAGYAPAGGSNNYVQLQDDTPGVAQIGHFNIDGVGIAGSLDAGTISTSGTSRITAAGVLQNVTNGDASSFFTGGSLPVNRGGTGMSSFTQYGVVFGNGTGGLGVTVAGLDNQCLVGNNGAAPTWIDCDVAAAGTTPGGTAGGDLGGNYPNPTIAKLQGTDLLINSPSAGSILVYSTTDSRWNNAAVSGDVAISETGVAAIQPNSVAFGTDTTGNYVSALGTLTGLSVTGNTGEGSTPAISVTYGSTANTAVQGNTSITVSAGTNLTGGGSITLGAGGTVTLNVTASPSFTSLSLTNALGVASGGTGSNSFTSNGILYGNGAGAIGSTIAGATGQCLVANTGSAPSWAECEAVAGGAVPGGGAGGDLTGTYPSPSIAKLQGTTIAISSLAGGQFLMYNGTNWLNQGISGDASVAGNGTLTINDNAITTSKIGNGQVTNGKLQNSSVTVTAGTGLTGGGSTALGGTTTLNVAYGAVAGTAVQGSTSLVCAAGTGNLSGGGETITLGSGGACGNLSISNAPTFSTSVTSPQFILTGAGSNGNVQVATLGQTTTYTLPDPGSSSATICLSSGNCASSGAAGGDLTGSYPNPTVAKLQGSNLTVSGVIAGQMLVYSVTDGTWKNVSVSGDVSLGENGLATIQPNSVGLGTDTTGNFVATFGALTGLTTTGNTGEGSTPTLSVSYGGTANTAVQGNTTLICPSGTGNLSGGGTSITLGLGGTCGALDTVANPSFTSLTLTNALGVTSGGTGASSLTNGGVLLGGGTSAVSATAVLANGQMLIGDGSGAPTVATLTQGSGISITNGAGSITIAIDGTVCTTGSVCAGYAPASGSANYLNIQGTTPGTPQAGNFNITGTGIANTFDAVSIQTNGTTRITSGGVLQNVTHADAGNFFTAGSLTVARGGTGAATFTANGLLYGNGTGALGVTAVGTNGQCLVGNTGAAPSWSSCTTVAGGSAPGGSAGGDLTGTYPNPTISKLQGSNLLINSPVGGHVLIYSQTNGRWENMLISSDIVINETGVATIQANSVALGTDTTGNYVSSLGLLTGLSATGNSGEGSTPTLAVLYGTDSNTAVQGNITMSCSSGTGNLTGGGNTLTLGSGGTCNAIAITNSPTFSTSVTSPVFQGSTSLTLNTLATAGANDIIFSTAGVQVATILENGNFGIGSGVTAPTAKLQVDGTTLVKTSSNTVSAFEIQNSSNAVLLTADTTNQTVSIGVASGGKLISIPASVSLGTAVTIDTTTSAAATEAVNQKKIVKLSDGKLVAIFNGGGPTAETWYSTNNGASWTEYGSGSISGWANGSISSYVDSGGTERLVAAWKQSGTGGGRTDAYAYVMVGTFNAGRTTLTWGTAYNIDSFNANYPDLVVMAEGTGGVAHVIWGNGNPNMHVYQYRIPITAAGAIDTGNVGGFVDTIINTSNFHPYPTIDYNPTTKDVYAAWSWGGTGANRGIRFKKATYSAGTWTWGSEVDVDTMHYMQVSNFGSIRLVWDGTRVVVGGMVFDGSNYRVRVYDSTNFTSFTNRITADIGTSMYATSLAVDKYSGDVYLLGNSHNGSNYTNVRYYKATRSGSTLTLGDPVVAETITGPSSNPMFINANSFDGRIALIYTTGTGSPYNVKFNSFTITQGSSTYDTSSKLVVNGNIEASSITINGVAIGSGGGGSSQWLQNASDIYYSSGKVGIGTNTPTAQLHVSGSTASTALLKVTDGTSTAADVFTIADEGASLFKNRTNSTAAFDVQNAAGSTIFNVDSTNQRVTIGAASGQKVIGVSSETIGSPTTITTSTNSSATSAGYQRKLAKLSTGRTVAIYNTLSTDYASLYYSDNGTSWTNLVPGNGIDGWSNGSISTYVDAGGTERLVAFWKQSTTGGGRVAGYYYAMVGTFNSARSSLTWGTALNMAGSTGLQAGYNYPDVVTFADGTGAQAAFVMSFNRSFQSNTQSYTVYQRIPIDASGNFGTASIDGLTDFSGTDNWGVLAGDYATSSWSYPSIDYNPLTKDVYVGWSAGATGASHGIRFKRAAYSAGTWTWGSEVAIDTTRYIVNDSTMLTLRYDPSGPRVVIGAELYDGSNGDVMLYDISTAGTLTTTRELAANVVNTAGRISYGSMAVDPSTGNVYFAGSNNSASPFNLNYRKWTRATGTSTIGVLDTIETAGGAGYVSLMALHNSIGVIYTKGPTQPVSVRFLSISLPSNSYDTTSKLVVNGNIEASSITINGVALGGGSNAWLQNASDIYFNTGKVSIGAGSVPTAQLHVKGSSAGVALLRVTDGTSVEQDVFSIDDEGATTFRNRTNSTNAFDIQNAGGSTIFNVDSTNQRVQIGVASGQKSITVFTGEAVGTPATVWGTSSGFSTARLTAYANQRKLSTLSTGRMVLMANDDTATNGTYGYFGYSDDGGTWTTLSTSEVSGVGNGSIGTYVDSGGTERIVLVWKQVGTLNGRTAGHIYLQVGAFNTARTGITWGSPISMFNNTTSQPIDYPDLVVHAEGTGGKAHVVYSQFSGGTLRIVYDPITISSSGVPAATVTAGAISDHGGAAHAFTSIDMDPATKKLFLGWTTGNTGAGQGTRYKMATYSGGTWTWGTEREIDSTQANSDTSYSNQYTLRVRWDGTAVILGGNYPGGLLRVWERDAADTTTTSLLSATQSDFYGTSLEVNDATRDIYLVGSRWNGSAYDRTAYRKYTRSSNTWGSLTLMDTITSPVIGVVNANGGAGYLGWAYTTGTSPFAVKYQSISFTAPTAGLDTTSKLVVNGNIEASSFTINGVALSSVLGASQWTQVGNNVFYTLGSVSVGTGTATARLHVSSGEPGTALLKVSDATGSGADVLTIADGGATTFKPHTNGTNTFDIQNAGGSTIFNVDSTNQRVQIGVASGQKSITVFTGEALNAPVVIQSNSFVASTATAYSNQKKFATLSTGRQVTTNTITSGGTPTAMFFYTDDGITWGGFASTDITGWSNGSISSYVDAGGIERLVAVWKQSGTGGGRTTDYVYAMVGTFNTARTTLTWGTATVVQGGSVPQRFNYPDLVAHSEGAGGKAHIMMGYQDSSAANLVNYYPVTIDGSGVPTLGTVVTPGAQSNVNINPFASITMNPSTKDLYVAWTNGTTGAGKGLRFQRATYASGVWTWNTEVEVDNGYFVQNAADQGMVVRFDGTRVIIGGVLKTASNNQLVFWESSNFTSFGSAKFSEVIANSTFFYGFGMAVNPTNGDIYFSGSQYNGSVYADAAYRKWTRATSTMGSRVIVEAFTTNAVSPPYVHAHYGNNRINFTYTTGASSPYTVKYAAITFTTPTTGLDTTSKLVVNGNIEASSITINGISLGSALGSQWIQSGNNIFYAQGSIGVGTGSTTARLQVSAAETGLALLKVTDATGSGQDVLTIADGGAATFRNQTNSTAALDVQNTAGVTVFSVDTTNQRVSIGVASGQKQIQVPGSSVTTPVVAWTGADVTSTATSYSSQKHLVRLSEGTLISALNRNTGSPSLMIRYSQDNGQSWNSMSGSGLDGWLHGSISSYVDSGGTERLIGTWKQSGTGGGRVDGYVYMAVGTFNSSRNAITWGTAVVVYGNAAGNYPDVAVTADGSGGLAMIVTSYNDGINMYALSFTVSINSSGTPTVGSQVNLDGPYSTTSLHAYPSIDINLTTKDVYVAWTSHTTGSGRGIRFKRGVYAGSAWTWGANIIVTENQYSDNASGRWINLRWDAGRNRVIVGGMVRDASNSITKIWSSTDFTSFSTLVSEDPATTANRLMYGTLSIAPTTGDIYLAGTLDSGTWALNYRKYTQATSTLGAVNQIDTPGVSTPAWVNSIATSNSIEWVYLTGTSSPYSVKHARFLQYSISNDTTSKLVVNGNIEASSLTINGQAVASAGNIFWLQSGSTVYYAGGNVGIGTSAASAKLHVTGDGTDLAYFDGTAAAPELVLRRVQNLAVSAIVGRQLFQGQDAGGTMRNFWETRVVVTDATAGAQKGDLLFMSTTGTTGTERLRVTQSGNVGINNASTGYKLSVMGSAGVTSGENLVTEVGGSGTNAQLYLGYRADGSAVTSTLIRSSNHLNLVIGTTLANQALTVKNAGTIQFNTYGAGTLVTDSSGNIGVSSDERLKDVQGNFSRGLSDLLNIDPIMYKWNGLSGMETSDTYAGFSAQNIQVAIPEAVSTDSRGYLSLQDRPILAASVNAIKELDITINQLDSRITALENAMGVSPNFTSLNVTGATTLSSLTVTGSVNIQGKLTVANAEVTGNITVGGRILSEGNKPQIAKGENLGTDDQVLAASVEIDGTDTAGTISFVAGITPSAGTLAKVTFTSAYEKAPRIVVTATNEDGLTLPVFVRKVGDGFEIVGNQAPVSGKTYQFDYVIIGAQASN